MAEAAKLCQAHGADVVDINMGCPAKKFARKPAGSALLANPPLVREILEAVVDAVAIPITLKIRLGQDEQSINVAETAHIAQASGIQALVVHGRTRTQKFSGRADHSHLRQLVQQLNIPVIANGDIDCAITAQRVLEDTGVTGVMMGRGARRNPFLFRETRHLLETGESLPPVNLNELECLAMTHLQRVMRYYDKTGSGRAARQLGWLLSGLTGINHLRREMQQCQDSHQLEQTLKGFLRNTSLAATRNQPTVAA